jgi:hypothetical protein
VTFAANTTAKGGEIKGLRLQEVDLPNKTSPFALPAPKLMRGRGSFR